MCKMLHNKQANILKQFLGNYSRQLYGRELIGKVDISQKGIALALLELEKQGILKSEKKGNMKLFSLNLSNLRIRDVLAVTELSAKDCFLAKHKTLAHIFRDDDRIVGIFGSYAKGTKKKYSDVDVFVIGSRKTGDYNSAGKAFDLDVSIKYFTESEFKELLKEKNLLVREIVENHILLFGIEKFIKLVWESCYGLN